MLASSPAGRCEVRSDETYLLCCTIVIIVSVSNQILDNISGYDLFATAELLVDLDIVFSATTTTFLTVVDQSNTCTQIARPVWFNCSCQL